MGVEAMIPNFEQYIDSDGDGILNKDEDDTPEDFSFGTQVDVAVNDTLASNVITIAGLKEGGIAVTTISNGWLIVNNNILADTVIEIKNGDKLQIGLVSSSQFADTTVATATIGSLSQNFSTVTDDYLPNVFSFSPLVDVAVDSLYTSDTITISGLPYPIEATTNSGIIIKNGNPALTGSVKVSDGDQIALKLPSSSEYSNPTSATLDINGVRANFEITTDDYTPDDFSFTVVERASFDSLYTSETIILNGIPHPTPISLDNGNLMVNSKIINDNKKIVSSGDQINIQLQSGSDYDQQSSGKLKIGISNYTFSVVTPPNPWQRKAKYSDLAVNDPTGFAIGDKIYVGTGFVYENTTTDFFEYNPSIDTWTKKADFPGGGRYAAVGFSINGKGYLGMGYASGNSHQFYEYDPKTDKWRKLADFPGIGYGDLVGFTINGYGYVGLGTNEDKYADFWRYDPINNTWTEIASFPESEKRTYTSGFSVGGKGYIALGYCAGYYDNCRDLWEYDPSGDSWKQISDYPDDNFEFSIGFAIGEYAYVGSRSMDDNIRKSFWRYHLNSDTWKELELGSYNFNNYSHFSCTTPERAYRLQHIQGGTYLYEFTPPQE